MVNENSYLQKGNSFLPNGNKYLPGGKSILLKVKSFLPFLGWKRGFAIIEVRSETWDLREGRKMEYLSTNNLKEWKET